MEGLVREAIHCFKYRNYRVAAPCLGGLMASYLAENPLPGEALVPVPLHPRKLRERGYNQAELLATEVGKAVGLPMEKKLLSRIRNSAPQASASNVNLRQTNTAGAFLCQEDLAGAACILVDDVCTTGSTLNACAEALAAAGAAQVWALTLARESLGAGRASV
jgi:ComF family protein